jgi:hypothetical protein
MRTSLSLEKTSVYPPEFDQSNVRFWPIAAFREGQ